MSQQGHPQADTEKLNATMSAIGKKILVLSGKGGVGKSTVAVNLATELSKQGHKVGLLDVDLHGPSIPRMTGLEGQRIGGDGDNFYPLEVSANLKVMSIAFMLENTSQAVIWRGPMKYSVIQQLLANTVWGELDYLVIDAPPGTGDEPLGTAQLVGVNAGAVIVTTPQQVSIGDVRRCITFCNQVMLPIWGVIENMSSVICPHCGESFDIFKSDGGKKLADELSLSLLGSLPIDPGIVIGADAGLSISESQACPPVKQEMEKIVENLKAKIHKK